MISQLLSFIVGFAIAAIATWLLLRHQQKIEKEQQEYLKQEELRRVAQEEPKKAIIIKREDPIEKIVNE